MKKFLVSLLLILLLAGCSLETFNTPRDLNNLSGVVEIHRCFCGPSAYRYLIVSQDNQLPFRYNPVNLPEDFKDDNYKVIFSGSLLNDSSIVYTNGPADELIEAYKVRNMRLSCIRKCSNLLLNDTVELVYGKTYGNCEKNISIRLDSVMEDSRCPYNMECFWAGNAVARFDFSLNNNPVIFSLNTSGGFVQDTIISEYKIQFIALKPYPVLPNPIRQRDYVARIKITR